ncbi:Meiotic spindle formation protein mei-1 [Diplonema papillatum]|nr:Meiotic spindle formation protein mei-1 [Diplonema papillatum]
MKTELLIQMDGLQRELEPTAQVFVLGASNIPWDLDDAILRRLEKRILVGLPTAPARVAIFKSNLEGHIKEDGVDLEELAERTDGYTGSDINVICREAMMRTVRSKMKKLEAFTAAGNTEALERELVSLDNVTASDLMHALSATKAASHSIPVSRYIKWNNERGSNRSGYSDLD